MLLLSGVARIDKIMSTIYVLKLDFNSQRPNLELKFSMDNIMIPMHILNIDTSYLPANTALV